MIWDWFAYFALSAIFCWVCGAFLAWKQRYVPTLVMTAVGLCVFFTYIVLMWITLSRPPMRTMGETRLWYSFFLALSGIIVYARTRYRWMVGLSTIMSTVFVVINLLKPEIHTKAMMPALQSAWFAPHVIVYMFAYALFGAATLMAIVLLWRGHRAKKQGWAGRINCTEAFKTIDGLVVVGWAFLSCGMIFGALWAKDAWGHYWAWDPKETWAAITWFAYLLYMHHRFIPHHSRRLSLCILILSFCLLQMCWWGINYLPSAQGASIHTYNSQ